MINFNTGREDFDKIMIIVKRAEGFGWKGERMTTVMDVSACHLNGCPLDLDALIKADAFNLLHDISGIARHIDRDDDSPTAGKLLDCFLPRFARRETVAA